MNDYEGQEQEDTEAQAEAYDDQWFKNMEYLEAYDDAALDTIEDEEEWDEEVNRQLDILDQDRMARENGEKPAAEWTRRDFKDLLHRYPKLRHLRTRELQALLLTWQDVIDCVVYYKLGDLKDLLQRRDPIWYGLAIPGYYSLERLDMAVEKLWKIKRAILKWMRTERKTSACRDRHRLIL